MLAFSPIFMHVMLCTELNLIFCFEIAHWEFQVCRSNWQGFANACILVIRMLLELDYSTIEMCDLRKCLYHFNDEY